MPHRVNLDALIRRENFEAIVESSSTDAADEAPKLKIVELEENSFLYRLLRKPDFQRTTAHWLPDKVGGIPEKLPWRRSYSIYHSLAVSDKREHFCNRWRSQAECVAGLGARRLRRWPALKKI